MRVAVVFLLAMLSVQAVAAVRVPVRVDSSAKDVTGQTLVAALKGKIAESAELSLQADAPTRLGLDLITMAQYPSKPAAATVYSAVVTWKNPDQSHSIYLGNYVGYCGSDRVNECADGLLQKLNEHASRIVSSAQSSGTGER